MNLDAIPLFSALKSKLGYISERERLIAQNVANADTPGYAPQDLKPFTLPQQGPSVGGTSTIEPVRTNPAHLAGTAPAAAGQGAWKAVSSADSETTLDGNKVVLEDQMAKMTEARLDYEAVIGFYQKSLEMLQMAARSPGRNA